VAELVNYIPDLEGMDVDIFRDNLEHDMTPEEIKDVREWVLGTTYLFKE
jgi:hypothetical protein